MMVIEIIDTLLAKLFFIKTLKSKKAGTNFVLLF